MIYFIFIGLDDENSGQGSSGGSQGKGGKNQSLLIETNEEGPWLLEETKEEGPWLLEETKEEGPWLLEETKEEGAEIFSVISGTIWLVISKFSFTAL